MAARRTPRPITNADRDRVAELHAEGKSRNDIAEIMDRSGSTISGIAERLGLTFERGAEVVAATAARSIDLADRRTRLAEKLMDSADRLVEQMWEPAVVFAFGGKENVYTEEPVSEPPPADKRAIMATAGMCIDRSLKLSPATQGSGADDAKSMLGALAQGIADMANQPDEDGA